MLGTLIFPRNVGVTQVVSIPIRFQSSDRDKTLSVRPHDGTRVWKKVQGQSDWIPVTFVEGVNDWMTDQQLIESDAFGSGV
jgi:hypothetical protein